MSDREGLSEDDAVFSDSEGERLDYSDADESESESESEAQDTSEEDEAVATDEEEPLSKRQKVGHCYKDSLILVIL